jgi:hypothetical protein
MADLTRQMAELTKQLQVFTRELQSQPRGTITGGKPGRG